MYTPIPEKCPGSASVATRTPFERVEISSSSAGSYIIVSSATEEMEVIGDGGYTFCIGLITVAKPLERKVGRTVPTFFLVNIALDKALEEELFNILIYNVKTWLTISVASFKILSTTDGFWSEYSVTGAYQMDF